MMIFNKLHEEKGFTLVELLIVIAILAVLAVAAAPKFISYKQQADANTCMNNQSTIETAAEQWRFEHPSEDSYPTLDKLAGEGAPLKVVPKCPSNGTYSISEHGVVKCSIETGKYPHVRGVEQQKQQQD